LRRRPPPSTAGATRATELVEIVRRHVPVYLDTCMKFYAPFIQTCQSHHADAEKLAECAKPWDRKYREMMTAHLLIVANEQDGIFRVNALTLETLQGAPAKMIELAKRAAPAASPQAKTEARDRVPASKKTQKPKPPRSK
jgi:hypothetical protein